jgi:hypothetical protein
VAAQGSTDISITWLDVSDLTFDVFCGIVETGQVRVLLANVVIRARSLDDGTFRARLYLKEPDLQRDPSFHHHGT